MKLYYYPAHCSQVSCDLSHARLWDTTTPTNTRDRKNIKQNQWWVWQIFLVFNWTSPKHNKSSNEDKIMVYHNYNHLKCGRKISITVCIAASKEPFVKAVTTNYSAKQPTVSIAKATILKTAH